ncbi:MULTISPECIES: rod shape-determining protein MreD [Alteribacter]|uniref:Rod shape-determining protein MreD n=1 Tax=Alteribacter keqinensis TaxID=2483800 RepID=A0A3M7TX68_9BACI|nr:MULTISPECIES: rod shape-determining protein MreD [Alteribacter]MBM7097992.1 rod shape-determining protein MreD [Alteribacter salitolerans]RNA70207.1 rod shape-determining protein MreD [Alteribacter keqinensis]
MIRYSIFLVMFLLFVLEGTVFQVFAPDLHGFPYILIPRWVLLVLVFVGILQGRGPALLYAVGFGILYDVIYSPLLGVYTFGMAVVVYLVSFSIPFFQKNLGLSIMMALLAVVGLEYFVYGIYSLMGLASQPHNLFFYTRLLPTFVFNGLILVLTGFYLRKWILYVLKRKQEFI